MNWSRRFYVYRALTFWMPDARKFMPIKRQLLRFLGVVVGDRVEISSRCRFCGSAKIILHDGVVLEKDVCIGGGGWVELGEGVKVAEGNMIYANGKIVVGDRTEIYQANIMMANGKSNLTIGSDCQIAHMVSLKTSHHEIEPNNKCIAGREKFTDIVIGNGCWLCAGAIVIPGVSVGEKCVIAAGAVVTHDVPAYSFVAGVPAVVKKAYVRMEM